MYKDMSTPAQELCYKFLDAYNDALNKDTFVEQMKVHCPDLVLLEAIWEIIDFLHLGGNQ